MYSVNLSKKLKRFTFKISAVFLASLFVVVLGPNLLELEGSQALAKKKKGGRFCSQTAQAVYKACLDEIADEYWIAYANCINVKDSEEREDCFKDAKKGEAGYKAAKEECKDQYKARLDVCDDVGEDRYDPKIGDLEWVDDPAAIGDTVDPNPYFPLVPGNKWTYKAYEEGNPDPTETIVVEVLAGESIVIEGVNCVVVRDIVYEGDSTDEEDIIEDTYDWYGQQTDGTVWYFGEWSLSKLDCDPEELCEGLYSEDGSWKSGWDGGKAGIIMFANPAVVDPGTTYRQEVSWGNAEDVAELVSFDEESVDVPFGTYDDNVLQNREFSPLEPDVEEFKYYAEKVGVVLEENEEDGTWVELIDFEN